jgi:hypothetical protein
MARSRVSDRGPRHERVGTGHKQHFKTGSALCTTALTTFVCDLAESAQEAFAIPDTATNPSGTSDGKRKTLKTS